MESINNNFNNENFNVNIENLNLLLNISNRINQLDDFVNELNLVIFENKNPDLLSINQKEYIRQEKINKKINDIFLPYMIYSKMCLENSNDI